MGQSYRIAAQVGFVKPKREGGRGARSAPAKSPRRPEKPSHPVVTPEEELDAAHYIAGMTAKLEAVASAARLDRLVYFLGMAKVESEMFVRAHGAEGGAEEESDESAVGPHPENNSFD
jgi:hypothetical protein